MFFLDLLTINRSVCLIDITLAQFLEKKNIRCVVNINWNCIGKVFFYISLD